MATPSRQRLIDELQKLEHRTLIPKATLQPLIQDYAEQREDFTWTESFMSGRGPQNYTFTLSARLKNVRICFCDLEYTTYQQFADICLIRVLCDLAKTDFDDFLFGAVFEREGCGWGGRGGELVALLREGDVEKVILGIKDPCKLKAEEECQIVFLKAFLKNSCEYQKLLTNKHFIRVIKASHELSTALVDKLHADISSGKLSAELFPNLPAILSEHPVASPDPNKSCLERAFGGDYATLEEVFGDFTQTASWPKQYVLMAHTLLYKAIATTRTDSIWSTIKQVVLRDPNTFTKCLRSFDPKEHSDNRERQELVKVFSEHCQHVDIKFLESTNEYFAHWLTDHNDELMVRFCEQVQVASLQSYFRYGPLDDDDRSSCQNSRLRRAKRIETISPELFSSLLRNGAFMKISCAISTNYKMFRLKPNDTNLDVVMKLYLREQDDRLLIMQCMMADLIPEHARGAFIERVEAFHGRDCPEFPDSLLHVAGIGNPTAGKKTASKRKHDNSQPLAMLTLQQLSQIPPALLYEDLQVGRYVKAVLWELVKNRELTIADMTPHLLALLWR